MFYSEYRPQKFGDLIGADHINAVITSSLLKNKVAHAYFFTGGRGIGKTTTARLLAKALMCENPVKFETPKNGQPNIHFEPCNECKSCLAVKKGNHLDMIEIDAASNRGIDDVRALRENVSLSPTMSTKKVYIVDEVHMLTTEASNALLKTLEEPPIHVHFILCTTNPEKVLDTIKSRCIQVQFKTPESDTIVLKLRKIADDKKIEVSDEDLQKIAKMARGAFREAETYLEQYANNGGELDFINTTDTETYNDFYKLILASDLTGSISYINKLSSDGSNIEQWTIGFIDYLRSLLLTKVGVLTIDQVKASGVDSQILTNVNATQIKEHLRTFMDVPRAFRDTVVVTLPLELALVDVIGEGSGKVSTPITPKEAEDSKKKPEKVMPLEISVPKDMPVTIEVTTTTKVEKVKPAKDFPYKTLVETLKETNHSIYLILGSCKLNHFDGKHLVLSVPYSFHKERLLASKIRKIIEDTAEAIAGSQVIFDCVLNSKPDAENLTDKNIVLPNKKPLEDVFHNVFGDALEAVSE